MRPHASILKPLIRLQSWYIYALSVTAARFSKPFKYLGRVSPLPCKRNHGLYIIDKFTSQTSKSVYNSKQKTYFAHKRILAGAFLKSQL